MMEETKTQTTSAALGTPSNTVHAAGDKMDMAVSKSNECIRLQRCAIRGWKFKRLLGIGAYGVVYLMEDNTPDKNLFAVKMQPVKMSTGISQAALVEINMMQQVSHDNLVSSQGAGFVKLIPRWLPFLENRHILTIFQVAIDPGMLAQLQRRHAQRLAYQASTAGASGIGGAPTTGSTAHAPADKQTALVGNSKILTAAASAVGKLMGGTSGAGDNAANNGTSEAAASALPLGASNNVSASSMATQIRRAQLAAGSMTGGVGGAGGTSASSAPAVVSAGGEGGTLAASSQLRQQLKDATAATAAAAARKRAAAAADPVRAYLEGQAMDEFADKETDFVLIIMKFVLGSTLHHTIQKKEQLLWTPNDFVQIMREILEALHSLHRRGIIHGDIKPDNVLLNNVIQVNPTTGKKTITTHPLLADFGMAQTIKTDERQCTSKQKCDIQPLPYRAPEVLSSGDQKFRHLGRSRFGEYDQGIDIWSFGVVLLRVLLDGRTISHELDPAMASKHFERFSEVMRTPKAFIRWVVKDQRVWEQTRHRFRGRNDQRILVALLNIGYLCLTMDPKQRPSAEALLHMRPFASLTKQPLHSQSGLDASSSSSPPLTISGRGLHSGTLAASSRLDSDMDLSSDDDEDGRNSGGRAGATSPSEEFEQAVRTDGGDGPSSLSLFSSLKSSGFVATPSASASAGGGSRGDHKSLAATGATPKTVARKSRPRLIDDDQFFSDQLDEIMSRLKCHSLTSHMARAIRQGYLAAMSKEPALSMEREAQRTCSREELRMQQLALLTACCTLAVKMNEPELKWEDENCLNFLNVVAEQFTPTGCRAEDLFIAERKILEATNFHIPFLLNRDIFVPPASRHDDYGYDDALVAAPTTAEEDLSVPALRATTSAVSVPASAGASASAGADGLSAAADADDPWGNDEEPLVPAATAEPVSAVAAACESQAASTGFRRPRRQGNTIEFEEE
jgi:serine/threonine protein kinase